MINKDCLSHQEILAQAREKVRKGYAERKQVIDALNHAENCACCQRWIKKLKLHSFGTRTLPSNLLCVQEMRNFLHDCEESINLVIGLKTDIVDKLKREQLLPWIMKKAEQKVAGERTFFYIPEDLFDFTKHLLDHLGVKYSSTF